MICPDSSGAGSGVGGGPSSRRPPVCRAEVFWGEIAPCEHFVQIYTNDDAFLASLESFVRAGLKRGETVVVVATEAHRNGLEERLGARDPETIRGWAPGQYLAFDAEQSLAKFMVEGWPDERLFNRWVEDVLVRSQAGKRRVRVFGEMVALLWARGQNGATIQLEHLWNGFVARNRFSLYCAYPKAGFTQDSLESMEYICATHSRVVEG